MKKEKEPESGYSRIFLAGLLPTANQSCVPRFRKSFFSGLLELLERLQAAQRGKFPSGQLRTLQRRIKDWNREKSHDGIRRDRPDRYKVATVVCVQEYR